MIQKAIMAVGFLSCLNEIEEVKKKNTFERLSKKNPTWRMRNSHSTDNLMRD